jgi:hypothetical protein
MTIPISHGEVVRWMITRHLSNENHNEIKKLMHDHLYVKQSGTLIRKFSWRLRSDRTSLHTDKGLSDNKHNMYHL